MFIRQLRLLALLLLATLIAPLAFAQGMITLADPGTLLLRGASLYKVSPGVALEDGDIVTVDGKSQVQIELTGGTLLALAGPGSLWLILPKGGTPTLTLPAGVLKAVIRAPGARVRTAAFDASVADAIVVLRTELAAAEMFVESGSARLVNATAAPRDAKRGDYWQKSLSAPFVNRLLPPRTFVDALPRNFMDALPTLGGGLKSKPPGATDHDISYAEAQPWLALDRVAFEKRFAVRLRDPGFRKAAEVDIRRYPAWDRMLHPEKYQPTTAPAK